MVISDVSGGSFHIFPYSFMYVYPRENRRKPSASSRGAGYSSHLVKSPRATTTWPTVRGLVNGQRCEFYGGRCEGKPGGNHAEITSFHQQIMGKPVKIVVKCGEHWRTIKNQCKSRRWGTWGTFKDRHLTQVLIRHDPPLGSFLFGPWTQPLQPSSQIFSCDALNFGGQKCLTYLQLHKTQDWSIRHGWLYTIFYPLHMHQHTLFYIMLS